VISMLLMAYAVPLLFAFFVVCFFWSNSFLAEFSIKVSLALGLALGISSCAYFVWLLLFGSAGSIFFMTESGFLIVCSVFLWYRIRRRTYVASSGFHTGVGTSRFRHILPASFCVVLLFAAFEFATQVLDFPHGDWDAWAIWNLHARFLFRGGNQWPRVFSSSLAWSHPDYPMLVPAAIARLWSYLGSESLVVPALVGMVFTLATVALLVSSLSLLRGRNQGFLAGIILLSTAFFIQQGASEYADVPLGFFMLASVVPFTLKDCSRETTYSTLAGVMVGFATWTKNEGLLLMMSVILARFIGATLSRRWGAYWKELAAFAGGLVPILLLVLYFKIQLAPPNDIVSSQGFQTTMAKLVDPARYLQIAQAFADGLLAIGKDLGVLLVIYALLTGIQVEATLKHAFILNLITLVFMLVGYFLIYVITPNDLVWQLNTSLSRLFLQIWPTVLFSFFLATTTPEQLLMRISTDRSAMPSPT
jgi:hypothetical protein